MVMITANELKIKGIKAIAEEIKKHRQAIIKTDKEEYIVLPRKDYEKAKKLDRLYLEFLEQKAQGKVKELTADEHLKELMDELQDTPKR